MIAQFNNIDVSNFKLNGSLFRKVFLAIPIGTTSIKVVCVYDSKLVLLQPTNISDVRVNNVVYSDIKSLVNAINNTVYYEKWARAEYFNGDLLVQGELIYTAKSWQTIRDRFFSYGGGTNASWLLHHFPDYGRFVISAGAIGQSGASNIAFQILGNKKAEFYGDVTHFGDIRNEHYQRYKGLSWQTIESKAFTCGGSGDNWIMHYIPSAGRFVVVTGAIGQNGSSNVAFEILGNKNAVFNGTVTCPTLVQTSDKKHKKNIEEIDGEYALSVFKKLKFSFYDFDLTESKEAGLIAQDVEKIVPEAVHTFDKENTLPDGTIEKVKEKAINYRYIDIICKRAIQHFIKTKI
ncbi:tail fiber domain-containing protein [Tenacibaculum maritimum]|uniref:tail fiber domain-containing protein n=1 Tax=Tenacibaculum maritimum TaxID=107401 RepID=UPI0012E434AA|nr:tail fiber domain-containing protein [Tenacibaculum maritimum]CAA0254786.1 hypothetical protein DPIF8902391_90088 [Tenacibaculum maritimum]